MKYTIKWLLPYWKKHRYRMFLIILLGMLSALLQAAMPFYIKKIINGFENNLNISYLKFNVAIMLLLGIAHFIINLFAQRNRAYMNYRTEYEIRDKLFSHILNLDEFLFFKYSVGDVLTRLVDDISEKIAWFSCSGVFRFIQAIFTFIAIFSIMFYLNPELTLICLMPLPFMVFFVIKMGRILNKKYDELQKTISNVYDYLETSFSGVKVIKANLKEKKFNDNFSYITLTQMEKAISVEKKQILTHFVFFFTGFLSVFLVYLFGGMKVIDDSLSVGTLVSFQIYTFMLIWPCSDISQFFVSINRAEVSIKRVDEMLDFRPKVCDSLKSNKLMSIGDIELKNIVFKFGDKKILNGITLNIKKGEKIAVVGKIGSSKSTLLKVIARILPFDSGEFKISGTDINNFALKDYQSKISYVAQESQIISDTLFNNITMYKNYSSNQLSLVLKIVQLEKDVFSMPAKLNTVVGNKGVTLSGGQRQRVSLARALIRNPELLIMDDSTNQMDANTEHKFWVEFNKYFSNTTVIFITHRTSTIEMADNVAVMDSGEIIEYGNHFNLILKEGLYQKIYKKYKIEDDLSKKFQ